MHQLLQLVATVCAGLFAGAALWTPAHKVITLSQAPLALVGLFYGAGVWLMGGEATWLVAAILIGVVVPSTFVHERGKLSPLRAARPAFSVLAATLMMYALVTSSDPSVGSAEQPREAQREQHPREKQDREAQGPREENGRIAVRHKHRAPQVLFEQRSEDESKQQRHG